MFNQKMKKELFIICNDIVEIYEYDGTLVQKKEFHSNIISAAQDQDCLLLAHDDGSLSVYNWNVD